MKKRCIGSLWNVMIRLCLIINLEVIQTIEFENPLEDQYDEFFKRYFDLTDRMMEFREK